MSTSNHPQTDGQTERVNQSIECYLRCFISAHPHHWSRWLALCEFWYNTNWHASLGKSPFELLYGHQPRYFGITASEQIASADIAAWLRERTLILASAQQHLLRMQQRMKAQADKNRTERSFSVGDKVFLRLQPYIQQSIARRKNHKLSFKFFGPFHILERVGQVAYKLDLPSESKVHPVFHVSHLKPCIHPGTQVSPHLPSPADTYQVPLRVLQSRIRQRGTRTVAQDLVQWSHLPASDATWEDREALQQQFPRAPAWGQAGLQEGGIVNGLPRPADDQNPTGEKTAGRPTRSRKIPSRLMGYELG
jgi:ribosomal protein L21E